jgi:hypothetical protein
MTARAIRPLLGAGLVVLGCGSNAPELPPELIDAIGRSGERDAGNYPPGPYGTTEGGILENDCFEGWRDPKAANFAPAALESICFSDFYDPTGENIEILLVNTGALWCVACKTEWGGSATRPSLLEHHDALSDAGFRVLGLFFQDAARNPASVQNIVDWAKTFDIDVPFGRDPDFLMGNYADANLQPFNMLVDARTMKILLQLEGDNPSVTFARVQEELNARSGS